MHEQREDVDIPVYHRQGLIRGTISHSRPEETCGIVQVYLKIEGKLKMNAIGEKPVSTSFKFLDETLELWSKRRPDSATASCAPETICPQHMDFAYVLPKTFRDPESGSVTGGNEYPLPPSHEICMMSIPGLQSQCVYRVNVVIVTRGSSWIPLKSTTTFPIPFKYLPRSRPAEPPLSHNGHDIGVDYPLFHATIKRTPELWLETNAVLQPRATTGLAPVDVQLFIPSGRTFGLADKIPFHLQLTGPAASLKALYSLLPVDQVANAGSSNNSGSLIACSSSIPATSGPNPKSTTASASVSGSGSISITISLSRQVYVKIKDEAVWKSVVIGQGRIHPLPPPFDSEYINLTSTQSGTTGTVEEREYDPERIENLDGAGEVECRPDIHFGHFRFWEVASQGLPDTSNRISVSEIDQLSRR
ncbi:hypothetical protein BT96DRAFT_267038 [Gymnopus androsaceus JB14]|uniref:Arrestin-like N-terminal domain-containing protein n=1 Tax=Gymnopus androsaceus JB14 TaxID=1447944 RepID=A0A6A4I8C9_9AGAR|nr:hypothetical protein BT96DRAFT_267038 [Gymnopus androsaceus JB14]